MGYPTNDVETANIHGSVNDDSCDKPSEFCNDAKYDANCKDAKRLDNHAFAEIMEPIGTSMNEYK